MLSISSDENKDSVHLMQANKANSPAQMRYHAKRREEPQTNYFSTAEAKEKRFNTILLLMILCVPLRISAIGNGHTLFCGEKTSFCKSFCPILCNSPYGLFLITSVHFLFLGG